VKRLTSGMTVADRDRLREEVLTRQLTLAYKRVGEYGLSTECRDAMAATGAQPWRARELHGSCQGEQTGGPGCLCVCHDVRDTAVITGTSAPSQFPVPVPGGPDSS